MHPLPRLAARLLEAGFPDDHAEATARLAVDLARDLLGSDDPDAVFAEALAIVADAAAEADDA